MAIKLVEAFDDSDYNCIKILREIQILKALSKYDSVIPHLYDIKIQNLGK